MKCFLHIGLHKTGTTSIQESLQKNKTSLFGEGVCYNPFQVHLIRNNNIEVLPLKKNEVEALSGCDLVLSSEQLSWFRDSKSLEAIKNSLSYFSDIKIIMYIRRQDRLAISHKKQAVKGLWPPSNMEFHMYGSSQGLLPEGYVWYLDYYEKFSLWASVFGKENIIVKNFDALKGELVTDFLKTVGVESFNQCELHSNKSFGTLRYEVCRKLKIRHSAGLINDVEYKELVGRTRFLDGYPDYLPAREKCEQFVGLYKDSNEKLFSEVPHAAFDHDFSMYPQGDSSKEALDSLLDIVSDFMVGKTGR